MTRDQRQATPAGQEFYEIRVKGHLDSRRSEWFGGLTMTNLESGETILTGPIVDQPALYGVLAKIRDLSLPLISVQRVEPERRHLHRHCFEGTTQTQVWGCPLYGLEE
jgi:hypothetical protein